MFCVECGHPIDDGARFCSNCGSPVSNVSDETVAMPAEAAAPAAAQGAEQAAAQGVQPGAQQPAQQGAWPQVPHQGAEGYVPVMGVPAGNVSSGRARSINIAAILCVVVGLFAAGALLFMFGQRLSEAGFSFGVSGGAPSEQVAEPVDASEDASVELEPIELDTSEDDATSESAGVQNASSSAGNLLNGGYVTSDDEWVYYAIPVQGSTWSTNAIGRMKPDGSDKSTIYRASEGGVYIWHMVAKGGRLFFVEEREDGGGGRLVSIDASGSGRKVIASTVPSTSVMLNEGVVYALVEDGMEAYDTKSDKASLLSGGPGVDDLWRTYGSGSSARVYYFRKGTATVYSAPLSGSSLSGSKVVTLSGGKTLVNVVPAEDALWLLVDGDGDGHGDEVMRAGIDGGTPEHYATPSGAAYRINVCDKGVFLVVSDSKSTRIELIEEKDGKPTVYYTASANVDVRLPAVVGDYLYFGVYDTQHLYRVPLNAPGQKAETVA